MIEPTNPLRLSYRKRNGFCGTASAAAESALPASPSSVFGRWLFSVVPFGSLSARMSFACRATPAEACNNETAACRFRRCRVDRFGWFPADLRTVFSFDFVDEAGEIKSWDLQTERDSEFFSHDRNIGVDQRQQGIKTGCADVSRGYYNTLGFSPR